MTIAETYEYNIMTARGIYGKLRSFAVARNLCGEAFYVESVNILRQYIGLHIENDVFFGDEVNEEKVLGVPFLGFVQIHLCSRLFNVVNIPCHPNLLIMKVYR